MISSTLLHVLRCPRHPGAGPLGALAKELCCPRCGAVYPVVDGIPVMAGGDSLPGSFREVEARQWDTQAACYDSRRTQDAIYMAAVRAAVSRLGVRRGDRVLDAGCGTGLTVRRYQRPGMRVVALDLSIDSLRHLKSQLPAASTVDLVCGDLTALPFVEGAFSKVLCANALQHLPDAGLRRRSVRELARVAQPGAPVVVTVHNYSLPKKRGGWRKEGSAGSHSGPVRYIYRFEAAEFKALLAEGLKVRKVVGAGLPLPYRFKLARLMQGIEWLLGRLRLSTAWSNMLLGVGTRRRQTR